MFRDFAERANNVMQLASVEARALNHDYVGTEHILLALVAEESGVATAILGTLGVTASAIRQGVDSLVQRGPSAVSHREPPLTPRSQQVIEFAREEAGEVNQKFVDTEHLLLALLREPDGVASRVLRRSWREAGRTAGRGTQNSHCAHEDRRTYGSARAGKHRMEAQDAR